MVGMGEQKPVVAVFDTKPYDREWLRKAAVANEIEWRFHEFRLGPETAAAAADAAAVCIFVNDHGDRASLEALASHGVRHLALRCAGYNNVDLEAARELGITVTRVPSYSPHAVAEHTLALLLALNRRIHRAYNRVREFNFSLSGLVGFDLYGKTAGVVGTGKIGRLVAEIFRGFKMRVLASDVHPNHDWAIEHGVEYTDLRNLAAQSDVLTLHTPLTPETDHLINADTLSLTKRGVYLINVSRGRLVDTNALIAALKNGHVAGVALDVYEEEEGVFFEDLSGQVMQDDDLSLLLAFPNVLITSHQAFLTQEALGEIARVTTENILRIARAHPPLEETGL